MIWCVVVYVLCYFWLIPMKKKGVCAAGNG